MRNQPWCGEPLDNPPGDLTSHAPLNPTPKLTAKNRAASCVLPRDGLTDVPMDYEAVVAEIDAATRKAFEQAAEIPMPRPRSLPDADWDAGIRWYRAAIRALAKAEEQA